MKPSKLFIRGGKEILPNEGTIQGDPIAMGMYVLGLTSLLTSIISNHAGNLIHIVFAHDLTREGKIHKLIEWWRNV